MSARVKSNQAKLAVAQVKNQVSQAKSAAVSSAKANISQAKSAAVSAAQAKKKAAKTAVENSIKNARNKVHKAKQNLKKKLAVKSMGSGADFQVRQAEALNQAYLERAIDEGAGSPNADEMTFEDYPYRPYSSVAREQLDDGIRTDFISGVENKVKMHDPLLYKIVDKVYGQMDPQTMIYLNKLFVTALPVINRIKLYMFLLSLYPELEAAISEAFINQETNPALGIKYNKAIDKEMKALLYKYRKPLVKEREKAKQEQRELKKALLSKKLLSK